MSKNEEVVFTVNEVINISGTAVHEGLDLLNAAPTVLVKSSQTFNPQPSVQSDEIDSSNV